MELAAAIVAAPSIGLESAEVDQQHSHYTLGPRFATTEPWDAGTPDCSQTIADTQPDLASDRSQEKLA